MAPSEPLSDDALTPARPPGVAGRAADTWPRHKSKWRQCRRRNARSARKHSHTRGQKR